MSNIPRTHWSAFTAIFTTALGVTALLLLTTLPQPVAAVSCSCYNGHPVSSSSCQCACDAGYLPPTCTFGVLDTVGLSFSLNITADDFVAELFTNAVAYAASANASFMWAKNVSAFLKIRAAVSLPGYAVSRLLASVNARDPWVSQYGIVSANVVTPTRSSSAADSGLSFDATLYQSPEFIITLNSIIWFISGVILVLLLIGVEMGCSHNDEHIVQPMALKHRRSQSMRGGPIDAPKKHLSNLNEHRRKAPPPTMSLPEQILDDFVDSSGSDDDKRKSTTDGGEKPRASSKYSLGSKSKSAGSQSLGAQSRSHSPHSPTHLRNKNAQGGGSPKRGGHH
ncbi:membrane-associated protein, putative [Bodo saltans]|uniref:Membrane-associated protein, putative n=1 Tax=Bodo saltans TaxID=75058 RepID=A0A0S4JPJ6_BODSA|nr:membrane-associated protein, putative [Bodo saltans]|eukprot:CUG93439.1 membrane-associated protein, putative [Bodo saltans]